MKGILTSVPTRAASAVRFREDPASKTFQIHVTALALVKRAESQPDGSNPGKKDAQIVARVSYDLPYRAPLSRRDDFANGEITLMRPLILQPGRYRLEAAMIDVESSTASVRKTVLVVGPAPPAGRFDVSDLVWARSVRKATGTEPNEPNDPLNTAYGYVTPQLNPAFPSFQSGLLFQTVRST